MDNYLILILGPTAVGKTEMAVEVARNFNTAILSADSRQFYREMNIGTAKPSPAQLKDIPHYFINSHSVSENYNSGQYAEDALKLLVRLFKDNRRLVMTGGSGLYIRAITNGFDEMPEIPVPVRKKIIEIYKIGGSGELRERLKKEDPDYYQEVDRQNPQRLMRALEVIEVSGLPYSSFRKNKTRKHSFEILKIGLSLNREELYDCINHRVDHMLEKGLVEEARGLYEIRGSNALETVGYKELFDYFDGKYDLREAIRLIKRNTRRYAKRQLTWLRKVEDVHWFSPGETDQVRAFIRKQTGSE